MCFNIAMHKQVTAQVKGVLQYSQNNSRHKTPNLKTAAKYEPLI